MVRAIFQGKTVFITERVKHNRRFFYRIGGILIAAQHVTLDNSPHS